MRYSLHVFAATIPSKQKSTVAYTNSSTGTTHCILLQKFIGVIIRDYMPVAQLKHSVGLK